MMYRLFGRVCRCGMSPISCSWAGRVVPMNHQKGLQSNQPSWSSSVFHSNQPLFWCCAESTYFWKPHGVSANGDSPLWRAKTCPNGSHRYCSSLILWRDSCWQLYRCEEFLLFLRWQIALRVIFVGVQSGTQERGSRGNWPECPPQILKNRNRPYLEDFSP